MINISNIIFVLGMHRSGTSAVANLFKLLVFSIGTNLLEADEKINKNGFFENIDIIDMNERIFEKLGSTWFDFRTLPDKWWLSKDIKSYHSEILGILEKDFNEFDLIAVKDPRICRLLPLWLETLKTTAKNIKCVFVIRNPIEVMRSLVKRDGIDKSTAIYLWLTYVLESEYYSRSFKRSIVRYDEVLNDWRGTTARISNELDIEWPKAINEVEEKVSEEISSDLRHHNVTSKDVDRSDKITLKALEVYERISQGISADTISWLNDVRSEYFEFNTKEQLFAESIYQTNVLLRNKTKQLMNLGGKHHDVLSMINEKDGQLERIKSHWSWRYVRRLLKCQ